jgi:hypothetical protein
MTAGLPDNRGTAADWVTDGHVADGDELFEPGETPITPVADEQEEDRRKGRVNRDLRNKLKGER